jgi:hypothetical protein
MVTKILAVMLVVMLVVCYASTTQAEYVNNTEFLRVRVKG